jgi:hypothetical protein
MWLARYQALFGSFDKKTAIEAKECRYIQQKDINYCLQGAYKNQHKTKVAHIPRSFI